MIILSADLLRPPPSHLLPPSTAYSTVSTARSIHSRRSCFRPSNNHTIPLDTRALGNITHPWQLFFLFFLFYYFFFFLPFRLLSRRFSFIYCNSLFRFPLRTYATQHAILAVPTCSDPPLLRATLSLSLLYSFCLPLSASLQPSFLNSLSLFIQFPFLTGHCPKSWIFHLYSRSSLSPFSLSSRTPTSNTVPSPLLLLLLLLIYTCTLLLIHLLAYLLDLLFIHSHTHTHPHSRFYKQLVARKGWAPGSKRTSLSLFFFFAIIYRGAYCQCSADLLTFLTFSVIFNTFILTCFRF